MYYLNISMYDVLLHRLTSLCSDLNRLIMDYLVIEGYKSAAEEFSQEANIPPPVDFQSIESRMNIREALQRGDVEDAIMRMNDLNPEVSQTTILHGAAVSSAANDYTFMHHA